MAEEVRVEEQRMGYLLDMHDHVSADAKSTYLAKAQLAYNQFHNGDGAGSGPEGDALRRSMVAGVNDLLKTDGPKKFDDLVQLGEVTRAAMNASLQASADQGVELKKPLGKLTQHPTR
jgi:hypothetical protein